jgi:hypothetical protein
VSKRWTVAAAVAWLAVCATLFVAVRAALGGRPAAWVLATATWACAAIGLVATLVPAALSLTLVRMATPLAAIVALLAGAGGASTVAVGSALVVAVGACAVLFSAPVGRAFVQASAYGDERRFPLRVPGPAAVAALLLWAAWAAVVTCTVALAARQQWLAASLVAALALATTWFVAPRLHRLSRRWLVLVPAGIVVHDHLNLRETLMVTRARVTDVGLAPADTGAADLTGPASGHVLQVTLNEEATVLLPQPGTDQPRVIHARAFLVAPSRPGEVLRAMNTTAQR